MKRHACDQGLLFTPKIRYVNDYVFFQAILSERPRILCHVFIAKTQATTKNFLKLSRMINEIETKALTQTIEKILDLTPTIHDSHFVKHVTNMQTTSHNNRSECRGIILI